MDEIQDDGPDAFYGITEDVIKRIENDFSYKRPNENQVPRYNLIRDAAKNYAVTLCEMCPPSRELSVALTTLSEVVMWANAAIARNE